MFTDPRTAKLVNDAKGGGKNEIRALLTHAVRELSIPTELQAVAQVLESEAIVNRERVLTLVSQLYGRAGADAKQINILTSLSDSNFAPAAYILGLVYESKGHKEHALDLFKHAMALNFKVAASKYYWCKRKDAAWPISSYYYFQAVRYRWASLYEQFKTDAPDEVAVWQKQE